MTLAIVIASSTLDFGILALRHNVFYMNDMVFDTPWDYLHCPFDTGWTTTVLTTWYHTENMMLH